MQPAPSSAANRSAARLAFLLAALVWAAGWSTGCAPSPTANVLGYWANRLWGPPVTPYTGPTGALAGQVVDAHGPVAGASVLVAEPRGRPHAALTNAAGRYRIVGLPPGQYVPAAVGSGYDETAAAGLLGIPWLVTVDSGATASAPTLTLEAHTAAPLPAVTLTLTETRVATATFPAGSAAEVREYSFTRDGVEVNTVRLYLPLDDPPAGSSPGSSSAALPLLFFSYPGTVEGWEPVSVAFASQGFAVAALSPISAWGVDIDQHTTDARIVLHQALSGALDPRVRAERAVALGGSFSSAILHRLLRDEGEHIAAWVTVGGIADAFAGAQAFYAGDITMPPQYELVVPALGRPDVFPLTFLRYSPVYTATQLPPTLIVHTAADAILPIEQAYSLEAALYAAGVPVETYYYEDVSHYLQIEENMTDAGREMFYLILDFARRYGDAPAPAPVEAPNEVSGETP